MEAAQIAEGQSKPMLLTMEKKHESVKYQKDQSNNKTFCELLSK